MRKQITLPSAEYPVYLIDETVPVSAYYRCPECDTYPGELHRHDDLRREGDTVTVRSTYTCPCGHTHHEDGPTLDSAVVDDAA